MASSIALIQGGTTYHLANNARTAWNGTGSPWTAQSTTPFRIEHTSQAPHWTKQSAAIMPIFRGSPPFRLGRALAAKGYDNVTEQLRILCAASSHDNGVALLKLLRRVLNAAYEVPTLLMVQPDTASQAVYYEVIYADVQEDPAFIGEERKHNQVRAAVTWVLTPFGGRLSSGEIALASTTVNNTGTGSPNNLKTYAVGLSGDHTHDGLQPCNVTMTVTSTGTGAGSYILFTYLATVRSRTYSATGAATYTPGDSVSVWPFFNVTYTVSDLLTYRGLTPRFLLRLSSMPSAMEIRIRVILGDGTLAASSATEVYISEWIKAETAADLSGAGPWATLLEFGTWPVDMIHPGIGGGTPKVTIYVEGRGTTSSCTVSYSELLLCYTFAKIEAYYDTGISFGSWKASDKYLLVEGFTQQSGMACLPVQPASAQAVNQSNNTALDTLFVRGELPKYISGASLYVAWHGETGHATNAAATLVVTQAPLYTTLRGNG